jgi:type I restriction enzyme M protein
VAFEEFMGGFFKEDFGQYFTPRELIAFAVEILSPDRKDLVLDPACGSGGFLLYALDHVRREAGHRHTPGTVEHFEYWHDFAAKNLFGLEINAELARVAKMNMIINDDGHTHIVAHDALDFFQQPRSVDGTPLGPKRDYILDKDRYLKPGSFDLVLTNPPFGSVVKRTEKSAGYLEQFELRQVLSNGPAGGAGKDRASIKTEILFLERVHTFLKPETGRVAIILPDGILTNSSLQGVREWLLAHFQFLAVISLPAFAFAHYDAGVKASLVFMRRLAENETVPADEPIFMALTDNIGYDATGRKTFEVFVEKEEPEKVRVEIQRSDLFDYRVTYEWSTTHPKKPTWSEQHREIIPNTGLVAQWRAFERDPTPFFV